ncbi:MAG: hypothetical protein CMI27_06630 [Opitutae bacterium]|nr:hypothetical protein [Opitutae bacterium]|tara:strand:+ start:3371 stop:4096 length:726 start_codon:yes stop_codon:yes gene_type:complete
MSRSVRSFLPPSSHQNDGIWSLGENESHHLSKVLRLEKGAKIEVLDGAGGIHQTKCIEVARNKIQVQVLESIGAKSLKPSVHLGVAIPKGNRWEEMIRPLTELGVSSLTPLLSERTEGLCKSKKWENKLKKWNRLAVEACKQSGNPWLPDIKSPQQMEEYLRASGKNTWIGSTSTRCSMLSEALVNQTISILIGPEGGWSEKEEKLALERGARAFSLGPFTLRVESAAVSALAVARSLFLR